MCSIFGYKKEVKEQRLGIKKVRTDLNPADVMTKDLKSETVEFHLKALGLRRGNKRAESALRCDHLYAPPGANGYAPPGANGYSPPGGDYAGETARERQLCDVSLSRYSCVIRLG